MKIAISGGTKGIGYAVARKFAEAKADLAICARTQSDLDKMKAEFTSTFPDSNILMVQTDMRDPDATRTFASVILENWGSLDVLINNAGVFQPGNIYDEAEGQLELMVETNLYSAYHLTRAMLPSMINKRAGHIFNICSVASLKAYPGGGSYSISKYALLGFSKNLREELKDKGIRVTAVMPGATWSASWEGVDLPKERLMPASDIANAIFGAWEMSPATVVEDIILRPQLGDL